MSLEQALAANTAAVEALTAALKAGGGTAGAAAGKTTTTKTKTETKVTPKNSREEMQALLKKVKEEKSADDAKAIIKDVGGVEKMADIPEDKIDAVFDAATTALEDAM